MSHLSSFSSSGARLVVAKRQKTRAVLKRQASSRNLYKMGEKAANHDAMMKRFNLRKMSDSLPFPSKFSRASEVMIDKAIGDQRNRRFSLRRSLRSMTSVKARKNVFRTLTSPITPKSWASTCHGLVMLMLYHFQLLYLPFCVSYFPHGSVGTASIAALLETIFMLDMLLTFNTAYVEKGGLVTSRSKIAQRYIGGWFPFDMLSAVPIQSIYYCISTHYTCDALQSIQIILMVLRLIRVSVFERGVLVSRVMRVANQFVEWVRHSRYSHLLRIGQLMWLVLIFAHYMACIWHVVSSRETKQNWSVGERYVADYYYAVSLIQGQGNISGTWGENMFSSVAIIVGSVILAIVFGNVAMLVSNFNASRTNYHRKMEAVYETMEKMDLPLRLRERVNKYYKHVWVEYESLDGNINKFQQELTHTLGIEIGLYKHMNLVVHVPFWKECTPDFLTQIVLNLDVRVYMPDDYVVRRRETGSEMMMINRGYCKLSKPFKAENSPTVNNIHMPVLMMQINRALGMETYEATASEGSSEDWSSDEEELANFGGGLFGASMNSRRLSGNATDLWNDRPSDFTDVRRFQAGRQRRPSYPEGTESKKPRKYREYLHPGQVFGEMSLLMNYKRTANIRAVTFVEMCVLSRKNFQKIISRYPEDRRRVLTSMLESCIEKNVIPFPWENIIQAVTAKRRNAGKKDFSRASVVATMTAKEAARILVEAIDINAPDESIKYGFQSFQQEFIDDSSLRYANSTDAKISDTLQRRNDSLRSSRSSRNLKADNSESSTATTVVESESLSTSDSGQSDKTLKSLLLLVESMARNIEHLQQDVRDLKSQQQGLRGHVKPECVVDKVSAVLHHHSADSQLSSYTPAMKEDHQALASRKTSFVVVPSSVSPSADKSRTNSRTGSKKLPFAALRKVRSNMQESHINEGSDQPSRAVVVPGLPVTKTEVVGMPDAERNGADRYPTNLSSRSRAARNQTLADMLWKRSNTSGDLLKHTEEERNAARLKRQIRQVHSLPSEMEEKTSTLADNSSEMYEVNADPGPDEEASLPSAAWLPRTQPVDRDNDFG